MIFPYNSFLWKTANQRSTGHKHTYTCKPRRTHTQTNINTHMSIFTSQTDLKLLISLEPDAEHLPGAFGRGIIKGEVKTPSKGHAGKSNNISS